MDVFSLLLCCSPCLSECYYSVCGSASGTLIGLCWIGMVPFLGLPACVQGFPLALGLLGLLESYFHSPGLRVVFACLYACVSWLLPLVPPFPFFDCP